MGFLHHGRLLRRPLFLEALERPLEYQRLVAAGKLDERLVAPPTPEQLRTARIFGFIAVAIGILLVIGILIGTYSSIAIAAPILVAYQAWRSAQGKPVAVIAGKARPVAGKGRVASGR